MRQRHSVVACRLHYVPAAAEKANNRPCIHLQAMSSGTVGSGYIVKVTKEE